MNLKIYARFVRLVFLSWDEYLDQMDVQGLVEALSYLFPFLTLPRS